MNKLMKKLSAVFVLALALAAFSGGVAFAHDLIVPLPAANNSGQSGEVQLLAQEDGTTKVVVTLSGNMASQPAGIYSGTCAAPGASYAQLNPVTGGRSETTLAVDEHELQHGDKILNVHRSATDTASVACVVLMAAEHEESAEGEHAEGAEHEEAPAGMPRTGAGDAIVPLGVALFGALLLTGAGAALRRRASL